MIAGRRIAPSVVSVVLAVLTAWAGLQPRAVVGAAQSASPAASSPAVGRGFSPDATRALLDQYCVTCHNQRTKTADLTFDTLDVSDLASHADVWEKTIRKLRGGLMPPPGMRRPDQTSTDAMASWLERSLDAAAAAHPNPGRVAIHRLNRAEYANAIEELLGVVVDASALLPKDDEAEGFDNVASVLSVSPSFLEQYIAAARYVSNLAVGNPSPRAAGTTYRPARGTDQTVRVDGLPPGTRGGLLAEHVFPADGDYKVNIGGLAGAGYVRGMEYVHTVVVTLDGTKVFQGQLGGEADLKSIDQQQAAAVAAINGRFQNIPITVKAGPHTVAVTFIARTYAESDEVLHSFRPGVGEDRVPRVGSVEIVGPFSASGLTDTPSRRRVFVCRPKTTAEESSCAHSILSTLARRAYRRPVTDADLDAPMRFYTSARASAGFDVAIRDAMPTILASPKFLYRAERSPTQVAAGTVYRISDLELASRLSFFLWRRPPDDTLLTAAERGALSTSPALDAQARRLLGDARSRTLVTGFAYQWLKLRSLDDVDPDSVLFPNFDDGLREGFRRELEMFVASVFDEDRSVLDLLNGNFTFVNERLALHYGIPGVRGTQFRRVVLSDPNRFGLLGKGAVLMATSYANRTAPVIRGAWILENLLGTPPAAPPPDVEGFPENKDGEKARTVREIMEQHRARPACSSCHAVMDPLGFALENFDAVGAWRTRDRFAGTAIDPSGRLADGTAVSGPIDLRKAIQRRPEQFVQTLTERMMTYALGRTVEAHDMPAVRAIVRDAAKQNYRVSAIVGGIIRSVPFQMRQKPTENVGRVLPGPTASVGRVLSDPLVGAPQ